MAKKDKLNLVIIGLGLLGGSLGLCLSGEYNIYGISRKQITLTKAKRKKVIKAGDTNPERVLPLADIVVIATPVSAIPEWLDMAEKYCSPGTLVTDVGSTKEKIVRFAENRKYKKIFFVGSHPMAGSHEVGIDFAEKKLFDNQLIFMTPTPRTNRLALNKIKRFWQLMTNKIVILSPKKHDEIVAQISHLPHALMSSLVAIVPEKSLSYAAKGFRDTTRVAQGDPFMWKDILLSNRKMVISNLKKYQKSLTGLITCLENEKEAVLYRFLMNSAQKRRKISKK